MVEVPFVTKKTIHEVQLVPETQPWFFDSCHFDDRIG